MRARLLLLRLVTRALVAVVAASPGIAASLSLCFAAPAVAAAAEGEGAARPPLRRFEYETATLNLRIKLRPGVPDAGESFVVEVELAELLKTPHPTFGTHRPVEDAVVHATLVGPPVAPAPAQSAQGDQGAAKRAAAPMFCEAHAAIKLNELGASGMAFTPPAPGVYGLYVRAVAAGVGDIRFAAPIAVGLWPLPEDAALPPEPAQEPPLLQGDILHGKAVCGRVCNLELPVAAPSGATPTFLATDFAAALSDKALLDAVLSGEALAPTPLERADVLLYLHSLHMHVRELFPQAAYVTANRFTISSFGRERLATAGVSLTDEQASGIVIGVYKSAKPPEGAAKAAAATPLTFVDYNDRVARDMLSKQTKIGYLVVDRLPDEASAYELVLALGPEPSYPIVQLAGRSAANERATAMTKAFDSFKGLGKFNDPKSLAKGAKALVTKLTPIYLRAAELATMYYAEEREFTAFDNELRP